MSSSQAAIRRVPPVVLTRLSDALSVSDGGFSIHVTTLTEAHSGYAVSTFPEFEYCAPGPVSRDDIAAYMASHAAVLASPDVVFGGWRSSGTGLAYLDISVLVPTRGAALRLARSHSQHAIWDFESCESISVHHTNDQSTYGEMQ